MTYSHYFFLLGAVVFGVGFVIGAAIVSLIRESDRQRLEFYDELDELAKRDEAHRKSMLANHLVGIEMDDTEFYAGLNRSLALNEPCDDDWPDDDAFELEDDDDPEVCTAADEDQA